MAVDVSGISYFAPILAFLVVFIIVFAVLQRTKLFGEGASPWVLLFVSFLVATIFVSAAGVREFVLTITPWFGALVISLFFLLFLLGFVGKEAQFMEKGVGIGAVVVMVIIFLVSGFIVFSDFIMPYLYGEGQNSAISWFLNQGIYNSRVFGAILLVALSAVISWVLVKTKK